MKRDKRTDPRRPEDHRVCLVARGKTYGNATITDLSGSGAQLNLASSRAVPHAFTMVLSYTPKIARECTVVWQKGRDIGVKFVEQARPGRPLNAHPAGPVKAEAAE